MYKAELPEITVNRIQKILDELGIEVQISFFEVKDMTWSCRLQIVGRFQSMGLGVNGKGMTQAYAKASAYGELMERIQNKLFVFTTKYATRDFQQKNNLTFEDNESDAVLFRYFPDEETKIIDASLLDEWLCKLLPQHTRLDTTTKNTFVMSYVPYEDVVSGEVCKLPYDLIRYAAGSTGMCAGNTQSEAILQGSFEIIERYVLQQIYVRQPFLPVVPLSCFAGKEIAERINTMVQATGWKAVVKDCSLGKGYPVLGLLIIDEKNDRYTFRVGSDLSPEIALQRCFTEIFQGIGLNSDTFQQINLLENWIPGEQYRISMESGRGQFPASIFIQKHSDSDIVLNGVFVSKQGVSDSFPKLGSSIDENYDNMLEWLKQRELKLYVRKNSFLGFPAFHLFIPGMSGVDEQLFDVMKVLPVGDKYYEIKPEYRLKTLTEAEAVNMINEYRTYSSASVRLFDYCNAGFNFFNRNLLLALLSFFVGNYKDAASFMGLFLNDSQKAGRRQDSYYYCIRDFFCLISSPAYSAVEVSEILKEIYGTSIASEVVNDMSDPCHIFNSFPIPNGFDCIHCPVKAHCAFDKAVEFERLIQSVQIGTSL